MDLEKEREFKLIEDSLVKKLLRNSPLPGPINFWWQNRLLHRKFLREREKVLNCHLYYLNNEEQWQNNDKNNQPPPVLVRLHCCSLLCTWENFLIGDQLLDTQDLQDCLIIYWQSQIQFLKRFETCIFGYTAFICCLATITMIYIGQTPRLSFCNVRQLLVSVIISKTTNNIMYHPVLT